MTTCPACGTDNREWASHCGECGRPLPDDTRQPPRSSEEPQTNRLPAWLRQDIEGIQDQTAHPSDRGTGSARSASHLPSIPDGGLARSMPAWLDSPRDNLSSESVQSSRAQHAPIAPDDTPDVTTFLSPTDLPAWLRRLADAESPRVDHPTDTPSSPRPPVTAARSESIIPPLPARHAVPTASPPTPHAPVATSTLPEPRVSHTAAPTSHRGTALILMGLAVALLVIAYAVYLGATG